MSISENKVLVERKVTFESVITSDSPSVMKMMQDDYSLLFKFVVALLTDYLNYTHPQMISQANTFAGDLIESRPTWKAEDFINVFKFLRQNPTDTNLNMTPERLMNRINTEYEERRSQALEDYHNTNKTVSRGHADLGRRQDKDQNIKDLIVKHKGQSNIALIGHGNPNQEYFER